jgi:hypothetical protein
MKDGLILAQSIGCNRIILEADCLEVINIMMEGRNSLGIAEHCYYLASEFLGVIFEHPYHVANSVAHELARVARGSREQVWLSDPPDFLISLFFERYNLYFE